MRTAQEIFDQVKQHLLTQNAFSMNADLLCMYRGPAGMKCAIGCLIPDEDYTSEMERRTLDSEIFRALLPDALKHEFEFHRSLLRTLQYLHDDVDIQEWPSKLHNVAIEHGLQG